MKNKKLFRFAAAAIVAASTMLFAACGGGGGSDDELRDFSDEVTEAVEDGDYDDLDGIAARFGADDDAVEDVKDAIDDLDEDIEDSDREINMEGLAKALADDIDDALDDADDIDNAVLAVADAISDVDVSSWAMVPSSEDDDDDEERTGSGGARVGDTGDRGGRTLTGNGPSTNLGSNGSAGACQPGDKVGTWSEGNAPFRIEVGGHGLQHLDFYPEEGVKAISFAIGMIDDPAGVPDLAWGFGSMWEWNPPGCDYDLVADLTRYATARVDSGHSGLVVMWGTWEILENVGDLSDEEAEALVALHVTAFENSEDSEGVSPFGSR